MECRSTYVSYLKREPSEDGFTFANIQNSFIRKIEMEGGEFVTAIADLSANWNIISGIWIYWRKNSANTRE